MGVWIETGNNRDSDPDSRVTPCMGVWIETKMLNTGEPSSFVTPCMGVWIETNSGETLAQGIKSHPVWVCGLKH